ncbi:uncharacterized protein LOC126611615 isoform X36 [Malus sylvestris]|uniref:uncharacterized protein LOC126611615 isoform X35 n=1 Tax=Malus sylvestris TaxID=3752 RepID=UPI0021AC21E3|nr:uncharacterized protein LOC126611615 isoform X35 [Malus sylvestris]XP_050135923.1 uncharacterized protein LOC126611615 isoform X36 [Malus sylvestris]
MAVDVAEFQWRKFLSSLRDAESELSGSISITYFRTIKNLISSFKSIKNRAREIDIMPRSPYDYSEIIDFLYKLNDVLAECRIFAKECKELNKKLLLFNPFGFYFIQKMNNRLDGLRKELESLGDARGLDNDVGDCWAEEVEPPPCPVVDGFDEQVVYGFDELAEKVEDLLCREGSTGNGFTTIGVVGIAGVGKTTLVHKVLKRERVKGKFNPIIWLPFSGMREEEEQFSRFSFETCILDHLGKTLDGRIVDLGKILERLNQLFSGKRYLIVLDDVQRRHINIEDRLWRGLPKGSGGAVIVTSRLTEVARKVVEKRDLIYVEPLDKEICWSIFEETMENNKEVLNISLHKTLSKIENEIKDQCHGLPLAAKALAGIIPEQIREIESKRFLKQMYIPDELLKHDLVGEPSVDIPSCPVLVFVDIKDEKLGVQLYNEFCYRLNKKQVLAVLEEDSDSKGPIKVEDPESVLKEVYGALHKSKKFEFADYIQKRMRIIIVGGDDVVNRILGVICDLKLPESPSIVPISHGTENNIPLSFGWKVPKVDRQSVTSFLDQVQAAQQIKTDSWHILIKMKSIQSSTDLKEIPHFFHVFRPVRKGATETEVHKGDTETEVHKGDTETEVHKGDTETEVHKGDTETAVHKGDTETEVDEGDTETKVHKGATETEVHKGATETEVHKGATETKVHKGATETEDNLELSGGFWSYFSLGVDAPRSCGGYWSTARSLKSLVNVEVIRHGRLEPLKIPSGIKSIVCLNLPSDLGGSSNMNKDRKNMKPSVINDGQLEIVGLKEVLLAQNERIYLDQVQEIRFEFKGAAESVKMRIDGSPLKQLPPGIIDIKISRHSQVNILGNGDCAAKRGFSDSSEPRASGTDDSSNAKDKSTEESSNAKDKSTEASSSAKDKSTEESSSAKDKSTEASSNAQDSYKGRKKFGSADTFKYSETEDNSNAKDKSTEESSNAQDSSKAHKKFGSAGTFKMP